MVYPHEHLSLRFLGHWGTGSSTITDRWSTGIRFGFNEKAPIYDAGKLLTFVEAAMTAAKVFHAANANMTSSECWLDGVNGTRVGVDGKVQPPAQLTQRSVGTPIAGLNPTVHPWNTALVISLRTAHPRGRASNGRVYWPAPNGAIQQATGRLAPAAVLTRVNNFKIFIDALNSAANTYDAGSKAIVASNVGAGLIQQVTAIRSDERLDSIERRENQQASVWSTAAVA